MYSLRIEHIAKDILHKLRNGEFRELFMSYERYFSPIAFSTGFVWDNLTLTRIDLLYDNFVLLTYLVIAGFSIAFINMYEVGRVCGRIADKIIAAAPYLMQFAFGGLFSGFFVFYSRSASFFSSWPFLLFLLFFLVGNEFFRRHYLRLTFQVSVFFIAIFSYAIFSVPVLFGTIGAEVFLASGVVSLLAMGVLFFFLSRMVRDRFYQSRSTIAGSIGSIFILFNILYFTNIIPPIPLSLKEIGIYHSVTRTADGGYEAAFEPPPWYLFFQDYWRTFHRVGDARVYAFSAVFAPTELKTDILHRWSYLDEEKEEWVETDRFLFRIVGGRDGGYRGFTFKQNIVPGKWRVDVITDRDQIIGLTKFTVVDVASQPALEIAVH